MCCFSHKIINIKKCDFRFRTYTSCVNIVEVGEERADGNGNKSGLQLHDLRFLDGHKKLKGVELSVLLGVWVLMLI